MFTPCDLPVFISKQSDCKQVELFADFLAAFARFNSFCSTLIVLSPFFDHIFYSLNSSAFTFVIS